MEPSPSLLLLPDSFVMSDDFGHDEREKLLGKVRIELCHLRQRSQPVDLVGLASRIGGRKPAARLEFADGLGALEPLREEVNERGIDIVDAVAKALQFWVDGHAPHALWPVCPSSLLQVSRAAATAV